MDDTYARIVRIVLPLEILVGALGNSLNLLVFTRKVLRLNSCTQYFIAGSLNNLVVVYFLLVMATLSDGYGISVSSSSSSCKIIVYLSYLIYNISPYLLVLASFDRFCCSSTLAMLRSWARVKVARRIIAVMLLVFMAIFTPLLVTYDWTTTDPPQCVSASQIFNSAWSLFQLAFYALAPPFLMTIFGLLTFWNIRTRRRNVQPVMATISSNREGGQKTYRRRSDSALLRMLAFQVFMYLICVTMLCVMMTLVTATSQPTPLMIKLLQISMLPFYLSYCTSFYIYTLSAQLYRQEMVAIVNKMRRNIRNIIGPEH